MEVALPDDMHFGTRNFIVNIQQLKFDNPGLYSIDVCPGWPTAGEHSVAGAGIILRQPPA